MLDLLPYQVRQQTGESANFYYICQCAIGEYLVHVKPLRLTSELNDKANKSASIYEILWRL